MFRLGASLLIPTPMRKQAKRLRVLLRGRLASAASARACVQFNEPDVAYSWQVSYRLAETYPKRCY